MKEAAFAIALVLLICEFDRLIDFGHRVLGRLKHGNWKSISNERPHHAHD